MNGYMGQLQGPFQADEELFDKIKQDCVSNIAAVRHLGIQVPADDMITVEINGVTIEIGKTGIYEIRDTEITSIKFLIDMDKNTLIDYTIDLEDD